MNYNIGDYCTFNDAINSWLH